MDFNSDPTKQDIEFFFSENRKVQSKTPFFHPS